MRFKLITLVLLATISACKTTQHDNEHANDSQSRFEQHIDAQGPMTIEELQSNYAIFAVKRTTQPSAVAIAELNKVTEPTEITVFFGTWCHDSQREIPELIKLKQALDNPNIQVKLIALDRDKKDAQGLARQAEVKYTPTIVVYQKDQELGRVVEKTTKRIGLEIVDIIKAVNE